MANKTRELFQLERLAFFSDAVFAIAITLLVIEVRLPEMEAVTNATLKAALLSLLPQYIGFLISFLVIGRFWIGHHRAFGHLKTCDSKLIWRNLVFLLTIAFMPFPTAVISEFGGMRPAFNFYVVWLIFSGFLFHRVLTYAMRTPALCFDHDDLVEREAIVHSSWAPIIIGVLALFAGQFNPQYAFLPLFGAPLVVWGVGKIGHRYAGWRRIKA
jgi:uncharacterized membrane protein